MTVKPREYAALSFATADIQVVDYASWWVDILTGLLAVINPVFPFIVINMLGNAVKQLKGQIEGGSSGGPHARLVRFTPTDPGNVTARIFLGAYQITPERLFTGITVTLEWLAAALIGPRTIPADLRSSALNYTVRLPFGVVPEDIALRIRWTVTDTASGSVLFDQDDVALGRQTYTLFPEAVGPATSSFDVACRVYRAFGSAVTEVLSDDVVLDVGAPRPKGAYVRWRYDVKNPQVQLNQQTQMWTYTGDSVVRRWSNLHRTDRPCQNASHRSRYEYELDTLDELPFPVAIATDAEELKTVMSVLTEEEVRALYGPLKKLGMD